MEILEFCSQAGQDLFVLGCLNNKLRGTFLDLGCGDPVYINNTYLLEKKFRWTGLSIDIDKKETDKYNIRNTICWNADCIKLDFDKIIDTCTSRIDYLSLDLEPASTTYDCLATIPFNKIEFSVITYEHDSYRFGPEYKNKSRELLSANGYKMICSDVKYDNNIYEDWYYNPKYVNYNKIQMFESDLKNWSDILSPYWKILVPASHFKFAFLV